MNDVQSDEELEEELLVSFSCAFSLFDSFACPRYKAVFISFTLSGNDTIHLVVRFNIVIPFLSLESINELLTSKCEESDDCIVNFTEE